MEEAIGRDILIVAGGIGLAPLRSAIYALQSRRHQYGQVQILYGARSPADLLFSSELAQWGGKPNTVVEFTVDRAAGGWRGNVGLVTQLIAHMHLDPDRTVAMMCGPEIMIRFALRSLRDRSVHPCNIYASLERNMKCAAGFCGRCQYGGSFVCRDGPVFRFDRIASIFSIREL
jgi:NAD(P)H-flavin reductase